MCVTPLGELTDSIVKALLQPFLAVPQAFAAPEDDGHDGDVHVIDQVGGQELADD